ncbi:hypothetical protein A2U01_0101953, partial [Trifolium medium]|nr:hypothetical protein [Trifolium medium]
SQEQGTVAQRASQRAVGLPVAFCRYSEGLSNFCGFWSLSLAGASNVQMFGRYLSLDLAQRA